MRWILKKLLFEDVLEIVFELLWTLFFSCIRTSQLLFLYWGSIFILGDIPFYYQSFTYILYYILVEGIYSRAEVTLMMNEIQVRLRVNEISNICWIGQAVLISCYKRNFLFELLYSKDNLADQINKNSCKNSLQHVF